MLYAYNSRPLVVVVVQEDDFLSAASSANWQPDQMEADSEVGDEGYAESTATSYATRSAFLYCRCDLAD